MIDPKLLNKFIKVCERAAFGASKYDPKSDLWTRITLFQGAPLPNQLHEKNSCEWLFPVLSIV
mgnify:CR=1 FL=1